MESDSDRWIDAEEGNMQAPAEMPYSEDAQIQVPWQVALMLRQLKIKEP